VVRLSSDFAAANCSCTLARSALALVASSSISTWPAATVSPSFTSTRLTTPASSGCRVTMMLFASRTLLSRWAMMITVRPRQMAPMLRCRMASLSWSSALVASSRIRMRGLVNSARAIATRCFWPPLRPVPCSPTTAS
jgi:hypothetical protein